MSYSSEVLLPPMLPVYQPHTGNISAASYQLHTGTHTAKDTVDVAVYIATVELAQMLLKLFQYMSVCVDAIHAFPHIVSVVLCSP